MKRVLTSIILFCSMLNSYVGAQESKVASKGAFTEGLFILQNKLRQVKETLIDLKKELTACFTLQKNIQSKGASLQERLKIYHCKLKQLVYPSYIDELSRLEVQSQEDIKILEKEIQPNSEKFNAMVKRAINLHHKVDLDKQLLEAIFEVDGLLVESHEKQPTVTRWVERSFQPSSTTGRLLADARNKVADLKTKSIIANANLFTGERVQEVYLERLVFFRL